MELKSRQAAIINELSNTGSSICVDNLLDNYSITRRTFYYDLDAINDWLEQQDFGIVKIKKQAIFLVTNKRKSIQQEVKNCNYYFSLEERKATEFFFIALSSEPLNINYFQKFFDVSKNTISTDIRNLKETFTNEITVLSTTKQGYLLQGEEFAIRKKLGNFINELNESKSHYPMEALKNFLQKNLEIFIGKQYDFFEIARCLIKQYEKDLNSQLYTGYIEYECIMILISWTRSLKGNQFSVSAEEKDTLSVTKSYSSVVSSLEKMKFHGLPIPDTEAYYMTSLLLGIRTAEFASQEQESLFIHDFVDQLIINFEKIACIQIKDKRSLAIKLRSHIRPLYYRLKYGLQEDNVLTTQIKNMYLEAFRFCKMAVAEIDNALSDIISEDEIAYLTVYFMGSLGESYSVLHNTKMVPKILVVNEKGQAEGNLIIEQLRDILGENFVFERTQLSQVKYIDLHDFSLIVSTVKGNLEKTGKAIIIDSIIAEAEYEKIINILSLQGLNYKDDLLIKHIIEDVNENVAPVTNESKLYLTLFKTLRDFRNDTSKTRKDSAFSVMIKNKRYRFVSNESSWENILFEGYKGIYSSQVAMTKLSDEKIILTQRKYLYNITDKIVLVYCFDYSQIRDERVSIIMSRKKMAITEEISGNIFIFFACQNNHDHFNYLFQIYEYCLNLNEPDVDSLLQITGG